MDRITGKILLIIVSAVIGAVVVEFIRHFAEYVKRITPSWLWRKSHCLRTAATTASSAGMPE